MTRDVENASRAAVQITRAAPLFDQLVDMLLSHAGAAPESNVSDGAARQAELRATRERLDAHYPEFQLLYFDLLRKHLGERLPAVLEVLNNELVQAYFRAQKAMEPELIGDLQRLAEKMAPAVSIGSSQPSPTAMDLGSRGKPPNDQLASRGRDASSPLNSQSPAWVESASANLNGTLPLLL